MKFIYTYWKVGDQVTAPGLEYTGFKDGMLVAYGTTQPGKMDKKAFAILKVPDTWLVILKNKTAWTGADIDTKLIRKSEDFRRSQLFVDFASIEFELSKFGIVDSWYAHGVSVEPIDASALSSSIMKDTKDKVFDVKIKDVNQTTAGSYTVGSGGDWSEWVTIFSDLGNFTGDITLTQISDITVSGGAYSNVDMNGYKLTITSDTKHYGNPNLGWKTIDNTGSVNVIINIRLNDTNGSSTIEISWLYFRSDSINFGECIQVNFSVSSGWELYLHDCIADGNGYAYTGTAKFFRSNSTGTLVSSRLWNCKVWDMYWSYQWSDGAGGGSGVGHLQNCVSYNSIAAGLNSYGRTNTVKNCLFHAQSGYCVDTGNCTYCAATDTSIGRGVGNNQSITFSDWILSTDDTSGNFLVVSSKTEAKQGGTNSGLFSGNTLGIQQNPRPHDGSKVSINAHQYKTPSGIALAVLHSFMNSYY